MLSLSPVYMSRIEVNKQPAPPTATLEKIAKILDLSKEDIVLMYDLAGESKNAVPPDLPDYIIEKNIVKTALRTAKEHKATDADWKDFIERVRNKRD